MAHVPGLRGETRAALSTPQVLVVGAGPVGLVTAITLARYGIDVALVEKRDGLAGLSRALVVSTRNMEIFRSWGLEGPVRDGTADVEPLGWVTHTLASGEGTSFPLGFPTAREAAAISPSGPVCAPQDHLEPILLQYLRTFPSATIQFGCELVRLEQSDSSARATVRDRHSGQSREIEALFVVSADGAHSTGRQQLGIQMEGPDNLADFQRIEFQAPLAEIVGDRRYLLTVITHPDAAGVLAPRGPDSRWGLSREVRVGQVGLVDYSDDELVELLATAVGVPDLKPRLERRWSFRFAAQIAERYRDRRVFLAGDAAHRTTPRGGTGVNTGIQDAFDLGWKLGWVVRGWAQLPLLDSYEPERRPVGLHNVTRSAAPDGARQSSSEALPWDLNGRVPHHWLSRGSERVSTLDLLGDGLTVLTGPDGPELPKTVVPPGAPVPVAGHVLDEATALSLGISRTGVLVLRPDGREVDEMNARAVGLRIGGTGGIAGRRGDMGE